MGRASETGRSRGEIGAVVTRQLLLEPGVWSAAALAAHLGETGPRRVQRIVTELQAAGWTVVRDDPGQKLTISP
ncbi:hypothetical protein GCM10017784_35090 [Deinococcus indicus]|nr:hypothetical protein GCM10017784_35090 [Deinococcus indicus]